MADAKLELPSWIADHLRRYQASDGADGHLWNGVTCLLLTTTGRKSGAALTLPLIYGRDGERAVIVASRGGAPDHPAWYKNLAAQPRVSVQIEAQKFGATARTATGDERARLWKVMAKIWPAYDEYQAKTTREIPVVVLERS
ncbi:MAG TPA: nitroreductase family deazaflavin-dependent oxidoreductase [Myxococcota bacterium]|jgi:deazaflavin-dependent oxidoreductase (nitroreductase family)